MADGHLPNGEAVSPPYNPPPGRPRSAREVYQGTTTQNPLFQPPNQLITSFFTSAGMTIDSGPLGAYAFICIASHISRTGEQTVSAAVLETLADWNRAGITGVAAADNAVESGLLDRVKGGYRVARQ